jgi:ABC-type glycerol-3-phosphate transport system permease component
MKLHPYLQNIVKVAIVAIAGIAALLTSSLTAFCVVLIWGSALQGMAISAVFGVIALVTLTALGYGFHRLSWRNRGLLGVILLASSFLLLPRPTCASEDLTTAGC